MATAFNSTPDFSHLKIPRKRPCAPTPVFLPNSIPNPHSTLHTPTCLPSFQIHHQRNTSNTAHLSTLPPISLALRTVLPRSPTLRLPTNPTLQHSTFSIPKPPAPPPQGVSQRYPISSVQQHPSYTPLILPLPLIAYWQTLNCNKDKERQQRH